MQIETVRAVRLLGHCRQGQTLPLYLECETGEGTKVFQTKIAGKRSGLGNRELCIELLGTSIAGKLRIQVARPSVVVLSDRLMEHIERDYQFQVSSEFAVGFEWKEDLIPFIPVVDTPRMSILARARLFALDLYLANGDRSVANPNVAWVGKELFVFDFEHCLELAGNSLETRFQSHVEVLSLLADVHLFKDEVKVLPSGTYGYTSSLLLEDLSVFWQIGMDLTKDLRVEWDSLIDYLSYLKMHWIDWLRAVENLRK